MPHVYCIFSAHFPPHMGGIESYTDSLANQLCLCGNTVIVVTSRLNDCDLKHEVLANGVQVYRLPCYPFMHGRLPVTKHNKEHDAMLDDVASFHPDRIIVNARFYAHSLDGVQFANRLHVPVFVVDHGSDYLTLNNPMADMLIKKWEHYSTKRLKKYPVHFAAVSNESARWLHTFGITAEAVFPNAIDATSLSVVQADGDEPDSIGFLRSAKEFGTYKLIVAFVGRYIPEKGIPSLLKAAKALHELPILFAFAGSGALETDINNETSNSNITNLGKLSRQQVISFLETSDVLCLPSRSEGFSTTLMEAALASCMPISTNVGGAKEIGLVKETNNTCENIITDYGILLNDSSERSIEKAVLWAFHHPNECSKNAERLREHVLANNTWKNTAEAIESAFSNIENAIRH